jgi:hypothetical protein
LRERVYKRTVWTVGCIGPTPLPPRQITDVVPGLSGGEEKWD